MKKILIISILFFILSPIANSDTFSDINQNSPYKTAIEYLKTNNVINGYPDGTFKPANTVNRAELLKILIESGGYAASEPATNCFPDVAADKWFSKYVCFAKEKGWITGYPDGNFRPEQTVNKVEALKIMGEIENWSFEEATGSNFTDVNYNEWYGPYLQYAETKGLLPESSNNNTILSPTAGMSRAAMAENIFRSIAVRQLKENSFSADIISNIITESIIPLTKLAGEKLLINEVRYDENSLGWIELYNKDSETINLENWSLTNSEAQKFLTFPEILLPPQSYLVVHLEQGESDLDFSDKSGSYYLNRSEGLLRTDEDAIALFSDENISAEKLVDFVSYCNTGECSQGIAYNMAIDTYQWLKDDYVSYIYPPYSELVIGRSKQSIDTNSSSDWSYDGGIHAGISTAGERNYAPDIAEEDFDEIFFTPFDPDNDTFFDDSDIIASINTNYFLAEAPCDPVAVLKQAIGMLKRSCLEESNPLGTIDETKLTGKQDPKNTKATEVKLTDKIKIRLGKSSSHIKGRTHPPETIDGEMVIEINLKQIDCNPENMKAVLFHELTHEKQVREKGNGIWDKDGKRVKPAGTNPAHGTNNIDPLTMVADCMEVETHLLTAQCLQKEQRMSEFNEYGEAIEKLLDKSKKLAQRYWKYGPKRDDPDTDDSEADPQRKGCWNYINQIKNNISPDNKKILNPQWLEENKKIKEYVDKWLEKIQNLILIFYEKYYDRDKIIEDPGRDGRREKARWERFVTEDLFLPKEKAEETIGDWEEELERRIDEMEESIIGDDDQPDDDQPSGQPSGQTNEPPKIILSPSSSSCITGDIIYVYADQSYDSDGYIEEYQWFLNDSLYGSNNFIGYNCTAPGAVTMTLRITDDMGETTSENFTITASIETETPIENQPPVAAVYPSQFICDRGNTLSVYSSESYDPDGQITEYKWYFGNGTLHSTSDTLDFYCDSVGNKNMELRVTDNDGAIGTKTFIITIN